MEGADARQLIALLDRLHVRVLVGQRLLALGTEVEPWLEGEIIASTAVARERGKMHELVTLGLLSSLEQAGIRALALKGSSLARELYGDVGARTAGDIDILVAPEDLGEAVAVVTKMQWATEPTSRAAELPVLHERLHHPALPGVELHWRIHWYEDRFAADALDRAERDGSRQPLVMQSADGLAALTLFYARDGFSGLRLAADVAAWWDSHCSGPDASQMLVAIAAAYPALAGPLQVGGELLGSLVGLPVNPRRGPFRWQVAAGLATPFLEQPPAQVNANASLVDLLLAPPGDLAESLRRERQKIPVGLERPLKWSDGLTVHQARAEHLLRVSRRWLLAVLPAAVRALRRGRLCVRPRPY
jgi:hypothetical protein